MKVDGQCHCGAIVYEAEVEPGTVGVCHCLDCQRLTGSLFRANIRAEAPHSPGTAAAFQRLPEDQQDALRLIAVEERSNEEVSDTIGCAIGTLKSRVRGAPVQLRSAMSGLIRAA